MKISTKNSKLAKRIFRDSTSNNKIDEGKIMEALTILKSHPSHSSRQILKGLLKQVERFENEETLIIESAFPLEESIVKRLASKFEDLLGKSLTVQVKENKELIGGVKIINGDNVWENSVWSALAQMKGSIANG